MHHAAIGCFAVFFGVVSPAMAQATKTFPEAECSYTLPGEGWEWLDPQLVQGPGGQTLALAKNQKGIVFTLRFDHLEANEKPNSRSYESFEVGLLESRRMTKQGGRHLTFKGIPSYQIDVGMPDGQGGSIRILYANNRFYYLQVVNAFGPLGPETGSEAIFQGFNFTGQPRSMLPSNEDAAFRRGQEFGRAISIFVVIGVTGLIIVGVVVLAVLLLRHYKRKAPLLGSNEPDS
jgi:hypothetical protein